MGCTAADLLLAPQLHLSSLAEQEQLPAQALSIKSQLQVSARVHQSWKRMLYLHQQMKAASAVGEPVLATRSESWDCSSQLSSYTAPQHKEKSKKYTKTHLGSMWATKTQGRRMLRAATPFWRWGDFPSCLVSQLAHRTSLGPRCPTNMEEKPFSVGSNQLHLVLLRLKSFPEQFLWHVFFHQKHVWTPAHLIAISPRRQVRWNIKKALVTGN